MAYPVGGSPPTTTPMGGLKEKNYPTSEFDLGNRK